MDIFCEYLVKKKSSSDVIKQVLLIIACILICIISLYLFFFVVPKYVWILPAIWGASIYGTVILRRNFSLEYEYIFTNGQLDIDVVKGKARRKSVISINCKNITYMAPYNGNNLSDREVIDVIHDEKRRGKYYADFTQGGVSYRILFQPPEKILSNIKKYNPRNVNL